MDESGCSEAQRDSDGDGVSDLDDACDDTPFGFPVLADGCTDESALDTDLDGDGYSGVYAYDIDRCPGFTSIKRVTPSPATPPNGSTRTGTASATTPHPPTTPTTVQPNSAHRTLISSVVTTMVMVIETRMNLKRFAGTRPSGGIPTSMDTVIIGATLHGTPLETTTGPVSTSPGQPTLITAPHHLGAPRRRGGLPRFTARHRPRRRDG